MCYKEKTAGREIHLPLDKIDRCATSQQADSKLKWCNSCAEALYCSTECQNKDWKSHKIRCGQTDRIDLQSYYPFIARIIFASHIHPDVHHPALSHQIIKSPNPYSGDIVKFPNGVKAKLVLLGNQKIGLTDVGSKKWWPTGTTPEVRHKLMRRIVHEGLLLPILLATCIALVSEIYMTTAVPASEQAVWQVTGRRRVRLAYNRAPIADFGIAKGSVNVTPQDRLAYYNVETNEFLMGQDPQDHYWIYFTTLAGDEYFLDCGMMTFNFCMMVEVKKYCRYGLPPVDLVPAFFYGREYRKAIPLTDKIGWKAKERFSILRNSDLRNLLRSTDFKYCEHDAEIVWSLMDKIAGRSCTDWEKEMVMEFIPNACKVVRLNMSNHEYLNFPKEPQISIEVDPGERIAGTSTNEIEEDTAFKKYLKKWTRRLKKGKISPGQWDAAFNQWQAKPHEARMRMAGMAK